MARFFRQATDNQFIGSPAYLESQQNLFSSEQASGLFEIQAKAGELNILVFARGNTVGIYRLGSETSVQISPLEVRTGWEKSEALIRTVSLPDQASRAIWLAMEFQHQVHREIRGVDEWNDFLEHCKAGHLTGLVEITSEPCDGFMLFHEGALVKTESIFSTGQDFQTSLLAVQQYLDSPWHVTVYTADPTSQAYECTLLRLSAAEWGGHVLVHFQDMVGQKLLQNMNADLNTMLFPQHWNIRPANTEIIDYHFFQQCELTVQAYRTLLQSMTQKIAQVIGGTLTQRILTETYDQLGTNEKRALEAQTLTPASFA